MIEFHPAAETELVEATLFYEERQNGLGSLFLKITKESLNDLKENPYIWKEDSKGRRKYRIIKFPYFIIYKIQNDDLYILAIAHASRKPGYWSDRD